jgi:hypothetical protein
VNIPRAIVLALAGGAAIASGAEAQPTVVVTPLLAELSIPVAHGGPWRWARADPSDNALEFEWELSVTSGGQEYQFGFSFFKFPGSKERTGSLDDLLKAGQASLWKIGSDGAGSLIQDAAVSATAGNGRVVIRLSTPAYVRLLFGARPPTAKVLTRTPDGSRESLEVSVEYR